MKNMASCRFLLDVHGWVGGMIEVYLALMHDVKSSLVVWSGLLNVRVESVAQQGVERKALNTTFRGDAVVVRQ